MLAILLNLRKVAFLRVATSTIVPQGPRSGSDNQRVPPPNSVNSINDQAISGCDAADAESRSTKEDEDGFSILCSEAAEHIEELIAEFHAERDDHGLQCWLLELIGNARSSVALPLLSELIHDADESFRDWAVWGLTQLDTKQARQMLWQARANGRIEINPKF